MNQIKKNLIYNMIYQILVLILPLITVPYVSRVLGTDGVGIYSYTYSIVYYFMLIAMLGINNYGNRSIAKVRDNKEKLSKTFIGIYSIQVVMSLLMILLYVLYILLFDNQYKMIALIQGTYIIATMLDINWFFFGLEKFKLTVSRNTVIKILSLIGIFLFVKTKNDVWIYVSILAGSTLLSNLLLLPFLFKEIDIVKVKFNEIKNHIKPMLVLFIPVIAVSLYKIMDKIMLGFMTNVSEVGLYEQSEKIINIPMGIVTALGTVMLPRISNLVAKGDDDAIKKYIKKSINFMMFLAFPICFGLIAVSEDFIPLFLGEEFIKSSLLVNYLASTIIFISFANVIRTQYLIPKEKDKTYVISVIGGAIVNLIINLLLIPRYQSIGACIGTIAAEAFVMLYQTISVRKELPIKEYLSDINKFFITSIIMFIAVMLIKLIDLKPILTVGIQVLTGCLVYGLLNIKYVKKVLTNK